MFPGLSLSKSDDNYHYYNAEFYITPDAVNKIIIKQHKTGIVIFVYFFIK